MITFLIGFNEGSEGRPLPMIVRGTDARCAAKDAEARAKATVRRIAEIDEIGQERSIKYPYGHCEVCKDIVMPEDMDLLDSRSGDIVHLACRNQPEPEESE